MNSVIASIRSSIRSSIRRGQSSLCNVYPFYSTDTDYLAIDPFTGNLKVMLAATSEADVHPDIVAGRIGSFTASVDPIESPEWNYYEIEAVGVAYIVGALFNGVVGKYAKDDVWYSVDMGPSVQAVGNSVYQPVFDGLSHYMQMDASITLSSSNQLSFTVIPATTSGVLAALGSSSSSYGFVRFSSGALSVSLLNGQVTTFSSITVQAGVEIEIGLAYNDSTGDLVAVDITNGGSEIINIGTGSVIPMDLIGVKGASLNANFYSGVIKNITTSTEIIPLDEAFSEYPALQGDSGTIVTAYNFTLSDVEEV